MAELPPELQQPGDRRLASSTAPCAIPEPQPRSGAGGPRGPRGEALARRRAFCDIRLLSSAWLGDSSQSRNDLQRPAWESHREALPHPEARRPLPHGQAASGPGYSAAAHRHAPRAFYDSDRAGGARTCKATTGVVLTVGTPLVRSICMGQSLIALHIGEAQVYLLVSVVSESSGEHSLAADRGRKLVVRILTSAAAGAATGSRRRVGRVNHRSIVRSRRLLEARACRTPGRSAAHMLQGHNSALRPCVHDGSSQTVFKR